MTRQSDSCERGERGEMGEGGDRGNSRNAMRTEFLVSFLVDARGGTMTACRKGSWQGSISNTHFHKCNVI